MRAPDFLGTPFHLRTAALNETQIWYAWDRYHTVDIYTDVYTELMAVREAVALLDMTPLAKHRIVGLDAQRLLDRLITRDATKIAVGQVVYTPFCDERGKLVTDGILFRSQENAYLYSAGPTFNWFRQHAQGLEVQIDDATEEYGLLSLQGPQSRAVLEAATGQDWSDLKFSRLRRASLGGVEVEVLRQGFTGEHGYELWVSADGGVAVWDALWEAGQPFGILAGGEYAIEVARVEAGLILVSADYTKAGDDPLSAHVVVDVENQASPFELGLGHFVDFNKQDFVGKQALAEEQAAGGPSRCLVGLELNWRDISELHASQGLAPNVSPRVRWDSLPVVQNGRPVGRATSVTWGFTVKKMIGFGHIERELATPGTLLAVKWPVIGGEQGEVGATVVELPFLQHKRV